MFSKILSISIFILVISNSPLAFSMCFNINVPVNGTITTEDNCSVLPETANLTGSKCYKGTINTNPPYTIEILTSTVIDVGNNLSVKYVTGNVVIKNQNGAEIYATNAASTNENTGKSAELLTFTGGTGMFSDTNGDLVVTADYDFLNNTYSAQMKGQICLNVN